MKKHNKQFNQTLKMRINYLNNNKQFNQTFKLKINYLVN